MQRVGCEGNALAVVFARPEGRLELAGAEGRGAEQVAALDQLAGERGRGGGMRAGKGAMPGTGDAPAFEEELDAHGIAAARVARLAPCSGTTGGPRPGHVERMTDHGIAVHGPKPRTRTASSRPATIQARSHPHARGLL